jgi:predicted TPR repeat methyltransferase
MGKQLDKYQKDFILLCEAGFIAVNQADEDAAIKLFKASQMLQPENTLPKIGLGYLHLIKLELKHACNAFNEVLAKEPNNEMAKTFLGLSLSFTPNEVAKGEALLEQSAQKSKDPSIKNLATDAIQFVEQFVKKKGTPPPQTPVDKDKKK